MRRLFSVWMLVVSVVGAGHALGELMPEDPVLPIVVEKEAAAATLQTAVEAYLKTRQRYLEEKTNSAAVDAELKKLIARAFLDTPQFAAVMRRLNGPVRWCEMADGGKNEPLPGDTLLNQTDAGYFLGAIVLDGNALPAVFYRTLKLRSGGELIIFQNSLVVPVSPGARSASRSRGELYGAVVSYGQAHLAELSARGTGGYEPLYLLDAFDTLEAGLVAAYMYGPVGNGHYAYLTLRSWDEASGTWKIVETPELTLSWDDVSVEYNSAKHLLTVTALNSVRWGGNGVEEQTDYDLKQLVQDALARNKKKAEMEGQP